MAKASADPVSVSSDVQLIAGLVKRHRVVVGMVAAALIAVFATIVYLTALRKPQPSSLALENLQIVQLTSTGNAARPAISPDGKYIAYVQRDGSMESIWIRQTATSSNVQIVPAQPGISLLGLTVTPDNNFVDFIRFIPQAGQSPELWRVPFLGGTPKRLIENVYSPIGWSADGASMAFIRSDRLANSTMLVIADRDGGNNTRPIITPDNQSVVFIGSGLQAWIAPLNGGTPTRIMEDAAWGHDVSPDGKSLAWFPFENRTFLTVCDLPTCTGRRKFGPLETLAGNARWTPDGRSVAYVAARPGANIRIQPLEGSPAYQLTHFDDGLRILDFGWSSDGKRLAVAHGKISSDIVLFKGLRPKR